MHLVVVIIYVAFLISLVVWKSLKVKEESDFVVAGRNVPVFTLVATLVCTWIGSGSLFGTAGLAFRTGFSELLFSAGAWIGIIVIYFIAAKVRESNSFTLTDILEKHYGRHAKTLATITIIVSYMIIAGYQFKGGGRLINIISEGSISVNNGILIAAGAIVLLTAFGGMVSVISIDIFNGVVMTLAILLVTIYVFFFREESILRTIAEVSPTHLTVFEGHSLTWIIGISLPTLILMLTESGMYQKFSAADNKSSARQAVMGMLAGVIIIEVLMCALAVAGYGLYHNDVRFYLADGSINREMAEEIILRIGFEKVPVFLGSMVFAAGVAIILSTGNTFLLVAATNLSRDLMSSSMFARFEKLSIQRAAVVLLGIMAYLIMTQFTTILEMAILSYTMLGASLSPALMSIFFRKKVKKAAGVASIIAGISAVILIFLLNKNASSIGGNLMGFTLPIDMDYAAIPALVISISTFILVSLFSKSDR